MKLKIKETFAVPGFTASGIACGIKKKGLKDLALIVSDVPASSAGVFTQNRVVAPSVTYDQKALRSSAKFRAIIVNSGNANACTGPQGMKDCRAMAGSLKAMGVTANEVLVASTGVIGVTLPTQKIIDALPGLAKKLSARGWGDAAEAILTTDLAPKSAAVSYKSGVKTVVIGGIAKGSGMIHPNMATMLAFMTTDAAVGSGLLKQVLSDAVDVSFNLVSVDTDQSTNDTCILLANGAAGNSPIEAGSDAAEAFSAAVRDVAVYLAREMARDGEGATKLIDATVTGAHSVEDARVAARSIVSSPLVKTAIYGRDPNWGRILMALGKTEIPLDESKLQVFINDIQIVESGAAIPFHAESVVQALGQPEVYLRVALNVGDGDATAWGCDLTEEYVVFNSAYTT
ncbi:MAG: bifunctional glutamate N-acetyltransferase/amino-acid acetyltransferase ArgJ [Nitrospinae bacterium]|nr:bifunctional glutamate N-acetyltransferase/amino-acid acetyltransferase ArgJ [Nitrospinota bacterium]